MPQHFAVMRARPSPETTNGFTCTALGMAGIKIDVTLLLTVPKYILCLDYEVNILKGRDILTVTEK